MSNKKFKLVSHLFDITDEGCKPIGEPVQIVIAIDGSMLDAFKLNADDLFRTSSIELAMFMTSRFRQYAETGATLEPGKLKSDMSFSDMTTSG